MAKSNLRPFIILGLVILGILFFSGNLGFTFGEPEDCGSAPFDKDCFCFEGDERLIYDRIRTQYYCESEIKVIDIDEEGWEEQVKTLATQKLLDHFPNCNMADCQDSRTDADWIILSGINVGADNNPLPHRIVHLECSEGVIGAKFSSIDLEIVDGATLATPRCASYEDIKGGDVLPNPGTLEFSSPIGFETRAKVDGIVRGRGTFKAQCSKNNGIGVGTVTVKAQLAAVESWEVLDGFSERPSSICEVIESGNSFATVRCDLNCPSNVGGSFSVVVIGTLDPIFVEELDLPLCFSTVQCFDPELDDAKFNSLEEAIESGHCSTGQTSFLNAFKVGRSTTCNIDSTKHICQADGTWSVVPSSSRSSSYRCPAYE